MNVTRNAVWPTVFYVAQYEEAARDKPALVDLCYRLRGEGKTWGIATRSKHRLFESPPGFFDHPEAQGLMEFCGAVVANVFEKDVHFPESWCHVTNGGGYHDAHA